MDATYAPQSPDLSSFLSGTSPQKQQQQQHQQLQSSAPSTSYAPRSPNLQPFAQLSSSSPQQAPPSRNPAFAAYQQPSRVNQSYGIYDDTLQGQAQQYPIPPLPPGHDFASQQSYQNQQLYSPQTQHFSNLKQEPIYDPRADFGQYPSLSPAYGNQGLGIGSVEDMSGRGKTGAGGAGVKAENGMENRGLGPSMGIDVKTKFPVARIKRIMQADEEVGKVAQVTPVAVSKALELFMISLVTKSADLAKTAGSKRVTAQHLKKAIDADEQFDFLSEITSKVVEGPEAGGKRVKDDDDSDDEAEAKPKKARGRKKKE